MVDMNFANPGMFLWLLPLAGLLVALYLLRMRRTDIQVPAVFLWPQKTEEVRANSLFQRLRFSWLLVLQLLALLLIILAWARPQLKQKGVAGRATVIVIDTSASMGAKDVQPSRLEVAKKRAAEIIQAAGLNDQVAVIECASTPRVVVPLSTGDRAKQLRALDSVVQEDADSDMGEALRLAAAVASSVDQSAMVVLSDGVFAPVADFSPGKSRVVFEKVGSSGENVSIQALGVTDTPQGRLVYCSVKNHGAQPIKTTVTLRADGDVLDSNGVTISPDKTWGKTIKLPRDSKVVEANIGSGGRLHADDYSATITDPASSIRVLLVTNGDAFMERALALDPRVTLDKSETLPATEAGSGPSNYDVVVFDGVPESIVRARATLCLGSAGAGSPVKISGTKDKPSFLSSDQLPLLEGVDFESVYIDSMQLVKPGPTGQVVAEMKQGPLVVVSSAQKRQIYLAFRPLDSDFPLTVAFPIFVGNALDFLVGNKSSTILGVRPSQAFSLSSDNGEPVTVLTEGRQWTVPVPKGASNVIVRDIRRVGVYSVQSGKLKSKVYASLKNSQESNIAPRSVVTLGSARVGATSSPTRFEDFWKPVLLLALAVLGFEWFVFARRS